MPEYFQAIGQFYDDFSQTTDEEVIELLRESKENVKQELTA
jgi:predicted phosphoribosyltransferase